ncbi:MAG: dihydroorotate dehydrogenase electron transfer subunit [Candidatus Bipolaricaulota bacterium]
MGNDKPRIREVALTGQESPTVKTIRLYDPPTSDAAPGQFAMLWVPDSGEIPIAISGTEGEYSEFTIKHRGETTSEIHELGVGDKIGVRGPYGVGFSRPTGPAVILGGGYGVAPLRYFYQSNSSNVPLTTLIGATSAEELLFVDELDAEIVSTDDGSRGHHGYITEVIEDVLEGKDVEMIYTAGPEPMILRALEICKSRGLDLEASLERVMKCGVGLCGSCLIDGFRVCKDGPVVGLDQLDEFSEFGRWTRTASGKKEPI